MTCVLMEFRLNVTKYIPQTPPLIRVLKCSLAPSSAKLGWDTIMGLLGMTTFQSKWKPTQTSKPAGAGCGRLATFDPFKQYWEFVDEMYDEAGKLPLLAMLLSGALHLYPRKATKRYSVLPQARPMKSTEYKTDYAIAIAEVSLCRNCTLVHVDIHLPYTSVFQKISMRYIVLFEVKKTVSTNLHTASARDIAQTLVEGYYAMLSSEFGQTSMVVALIDIEATRYFKIRLPVTRSESRHMEVVWHHQVVIGEYPPENMDELIPFIEFIHEGS